MAEEGKHKVIATARGVFDHKGGTLTSEETGVSIVIPPGAITKGTKQEIYFKVCQDNSLVPPLDQNRGQLGEVAWRLCQECQEHTDRKNEI